MVTKSIATFLISLLVLGAGTAVIVTPQEMVRHWLASPAERLESRILSSLRETGVYEDSQKRFILRAERVDATGLHNLTVSYRSDTSAKIVARHATIAVQPDGLFVRVTATMVTLHENHLASDIIEELEWSLDSDSGCPFTAWN